VKRKPPNTIRADVPQAPELQAELVRSVALGAPGPANAGRMYNFYHEGGSIDDASVSTAVRLSFSPFIDKSSSFFALAPQAAALTHSVAAPLTSGTPPNERVPLLRHGR